MNEIISLYETGETPEWLTEALCELAWVYTNNTRTAGYFNVAAELAERFIIGNEQVINRREVKSIGISKVPEGELLEMLSEGLIITYDDKYVYPSQFLLKATDIAERGNELSSDEATLKRKEMFGFLAVCLTRALVNFSRTGVPRTALSIFHLLSEQMLRPKEYTDEISDNSLMSAFGNLNFGQQTSLMRKMAGFDPNGEAKIIRDINYDGTAYLKPCMVEYVDNMRDRFRDRSRESRDRDF